MSLVWLALGPGCAGPPDPVDDVGNAALGITRFDVEEVGSRTSVIGRDRQGGEVARLDLTHGRFELTERFRDDYPGMTEVDGRKLEVAMHGRRRFALEKEGYHALTRLPAHPSGQEDLAMFLEDPHVKRVLDRWQIAWDPMEPETAYVNQSEPTITSGSGIPYWGDGDQTDDSGNLIPSPWNMGTVPFQNRTANACGGGTTVPFMAIRASRANPHHSGEDEWIITQVCQPAGESQWFGRKSCGLNANDRVSTCNPGGTGSGACTNCGAYDPGGPFTYGNGTSNTGGLYSMHLHATSLDYCWGNTPADFETLDVTLGNTGIVASNIPGDPMTTGNHSINTCAGKSVTLTRSDAYLDWSGWSGDCTGGSDTCTVTMSADKSVTATYDLGGTVANATLYAIPRDLAAWVGDAKNTDFTITMTAASGYTFAQSGVCNASFTTTGNSVTCGRDNTGGTGSITVTHTASGLSRVILVKFV